MIFFTADTHFYHANIIRHCNRPFDSVEEMNEVIIARFNARVRQKDSLYILGDAVWGSVACANEIMRRLNGKKYLIRGNHDFRWVENQEFDQSIFEYVKDLDSIVYDGTRFVLCHYPILEWDRRLRGALHCYGHVHNHFVRDLNDPDNKAKLEALGNRAFNVGVDVNDFAPVSAEDLIILSS